MIYAYQDVSSGQMVGPVDVCIVGSGAGGAVMAYYLARAGLKVAVLEKGARYQSSELGRREVAMLTRIQSMAIFTPATGKNTRVSLIAGECYGGGTVASESVTWDFPAVVRDDWEKLGLSSFANGNSRLDEFQAELNDRLNVRPVALNHHNPCNQVMMIGAEREGIQWKSVHRPVTMCLRCGNCTQGCRYGVKQDMQKTFLAWAQARGADAYCGAAVDKLTVNYPGPDDFPYKDKLAAAEGSARDDVMRELENRASQAPAKFTLFATVTDRKAPPPRDGQLPAKSIVIHAHKLVLAAGPVGTCRLLLKSKINPGGVVGKKFTTHPTSFNIGRFDRNINLNGWDGTNDTIEVHHYADLMRHEPYYDPERHGFLLEAALSLPWGLANLLPGSGQEHLELMRDMNHLAGMEVNVKTDQHGRITEDGIDFDMSERDNEAMLYGTWITARLFFRAGAKQIFTGLPGLVLNSPSDLDQIFKYKRGKQKGFLQKQANLYSGHIFGGAVMGADPADSFADQTGECHTIKDLWVADGSAFPTNVGVNCAMSVSFVARKIAEDFLQKEKRGGS